jgi:hypothetical protein
MHTSTGILKLVYILNDFLHTSANQVITLYLCAFVGTDVSCMYSINAGIVII